MRRAILLALLALSACSKPLPPGVERITGVSSAQAFDWSLASRRLAFVEGRFPDRTYLVVLNLASGAKMKRRLKGFVLGGGLALSRDGRRVLLEAGKVGLGTRDEPDDRVILVVDADDGRILSETPVGGIAALGHPAWSPDPIAVWNGKEGVHWKAFGPNPIEGVLHGEAAWRALLLDEPYLIVAEKQTKRPRMTVYDLRDNRQVTEWRVALTGKMLALPTGPRCRRAGCRRPGGSFWNQATPKPIGALPCSRPKGRSRAPWRRIAACTPSPRIRRDATTPARTFSPPGSCSSQRPAANVGACPGPRTKASSSGPTPRMDGFCSP